MKKYIFLFVSILLVNNLFSQGFDEYTKKWSTYFGGQYTRFTTSVIDSEGNIIVAGEMLSGINSILLDENYYNQFSTVTNLHYDSSFVNTGGGGQSLIAKFSPNGELIQSGYIPFYVYNLQIDKNDNLYFWGTTKLDTIATQNVWQTTPNATISEKKVIVKLNPDFSILWCTYIPGTVIDFCFDEDFNIYGIGQTTIDNGITTANTFQPNFITELKNQNQNKHYDNGIVFKLNNEGQLQWSSYYGVGMFGFAIAYSNNELITSFSKKANILSQYDNYYFTQNAYQQTPSSQVITKFDALSGQRIYSTYLDNLGIKSIICNDDFYYFFGETTGDFSDSNLISNNAHQPIFGGISDMYLGKFDKNVHPVWGTYIGGNSLELFNIGNKIMLNNKALYISFLSTSDNDFINSPNSYQSQPNGDNEQVIMKFALNGDFIWGSFFGGSDNEMYSNITPIDNHNFYFVGSTLSLDNISTTGSYQENLSFHPSFPSSNFGNGFIAKFTPENELSVQEPDKNNFVIFPNPTKDKLSVIGDLNKSYTIDIYNSLGQVVLQEKPGNDKIITINLSNLQSGTYYLTITSDNKNVSRHKLIIK